MQWFVLGVGSSGTPCLGILLQEAEVARVLDGEAYCGRDLDPLMQDVLDATVSRLMLKYGIERVKLNGLCICPPQEDTKILGDQAVVLMQSGFLPIPLMPTVVQAARSAWAQYSNEAAALRIVADQMAEDKFMHELGQVAPIPRGCTKAFELN